MRCEKKGSRMIPRLLAQGSGKMDLAFTKLEMIAKEISLETGLGEPRFQVQAT